MNIAIFVGGRSKMYQECFLEQVKNTREKYKDVSFYTFGHFNEDFSQEISDSFDSSSFEITTSPDWFSKEKYSWIGNIPNIFSMYYSNKKAFELIEKFQIDHGIQFNQVIKFRPDIVSVCDTIPVFLNNTLENTVYTYDDFHWLGGLNDQIALGCFETMKKYCTCYDKLKMYTDSNVKFHPETLLLHHIRSEGLNIDWIDYPYVLHNKRNV